jgi:hypothetical protein
MAGLRTNALVALGAALFELLAVQMTGVRGVNPTRIAAYVVSGCRGGQRQEPGSGRGSTRGSAAGTSCAARPP